jgi:type IV secretion system protein VirB10
LPGKRTGPFRIGHCVVAGIVWFASGHCRFVSGHRYFVSGIALAMPSAVKINAPLGAGHSRRTTMPNNLKTSKFAARFLLVLACSLALCAAASAQSPQAQKPADPQLDLAMQSSLYVKIQLESTVKVSALKPGNMIEGKLAQDIYSGDRELFPAGSRIRLTVDKLGRRRRVPNDHWPWVVKAFTPRHENYPLFQSAAVIFPDGKEVPLHVSLISINRETQIRARSKKTPAQPAPNEAAPDEARSTSVRKNQGTIVTLEAAIPADTSETSAPSSSEAPSAVTLGAGTAAKIILLGGVSASKSQPGDGFQARLVEPVRLNSKVVLPEGTLLAGKVVTRTPPRMLSRAGSIMLTFTDLTLPGRASIPIPMSASVTAAEIDQRSHTKIDPEGKLHGDRPGKAWMAINIGVTAGIAKEADDTLQLIIEAVVSSATDASTAGAGRIAATCAAGLFLLTRHGRDVVLPKFTEMNIVFDRPLSLAAAPPKP